MTKLAKRLGILAVLLTMALPGAAFAQQYYCTITSSTNSWVPPEFLIEYSGSTATVTHGWMDGPNAQTVQIRGNDSRRRLNYSLIDARALNGQQAVLAFRLVHSVASGHLRVTVNPVAFTNSFTGSGNCVPT